MFDIHHPRGGASAVRAQCYPDDAAMAWLGGKGCGPICGARPLERGVRKALRGKRAELLLGGTLRDGETLSVSAGEDGLILGDRVRGATHEARAAVH